MSQALQFKCFVACYINTMTFRLYSSKIVLLIYCNYLYTSTDLLLRWPDSPDLFISLSSDSLFQPLTFTSNEESLLMFSFHLSRGLPTGLLPRNIPFTAFYPPLEIL